MLDKDSTTLSPLPNVLSKGLVAVSAFGLLSFFCSTSLFIYLTWRLISWRLNSGVKVPTNQFILLIYNLLLADIQQALAFLLNISHLRTDSILVGTPTCWAQGWFVSTGDLASSVFILAIAVHTFLGVVNEYRLPTGVFWCGIAGCWTFVYVLAAIGPLTHGKDFYVRASAWCWIGDAYSIERLWLHYFWIFICMFSSILIYAFLFVFIRAKALTANITNPRTSHGATPLMILYPLIYTICTAPLAGGRIYALAGHHVSLAYFCTAGSMIACNGWLDVLLYASTRSEIVFSEYPPGEDTGLETFAFMGKGHRLGTVTTIQALGSSHDRNGSRLGIGGRSHGGDSVENLYGLSQIAVKGEVTVSVETVRHGVLRHNLVDMDGGGNGSGSREDERRRRRSSWDERSAKTGKSLESQ